MKIHFLTPLGRTACNTRTAKATTHERGEVTCELCKSVGVRPRPDPARRPTYAEHISWR